MTSPARTYTEIAREWLKQTGVLEPDLIEQAAGIALARLRINGRAAAFFEPGDSTLYALSLTHWDEETAVPWGGGRLVVAAPAFGASWALDPTALHTPEYLMEKCRGKVAGGSVIVIAAFTTILAEHWSDPWLSRRT